MTVFPDVPIAEYQRLVAKLRDAEYAPGKKIRAELYLGSGKFGAQMKYADKRGSPCVVIQGGNEKEKGEIQIKDLILGAEIAGLSKDRDDYLKKQAEAQFAVKESELVDAVQESARAKQRDLGLNSRFSPRHPEVRARLGRASKGRRPR